MTKSDADSRSYPAPIDTSRELSAPPEEDPSHAFTYPALECGLEEPSRANKHELAQQKGARALVAVKVHVHDLVLPLARDDVEAVRL